MVILVLKRLLLWRIDVLGTLGDMKEVSALARDISEGLRI